MNRTRLGVESLEDWAVPASFSLVMSGLDNPRGLAFGPEGAVYVALAPGRRVGALGWDLRRLIRKG